MNFGEAIAVMKAGIPISRTGWNGKGMFLYYVPENMYPPVTDVAKARFGGNPVPYRAYIAMKTVDEDVVPWMVAGNIEVTRADLPTASDISKLANKEFDKAYKATKPHWTHTPEGKRKLAARKRGARK